MEEQAKQVPDAATKMQLAAGIRRTEKAGDNSKKFDQSIG